MYISSMRTKILNYDKKKAKVYFGLLKFAELFSVFLFFFGFNWFGHVAVNILGQEIWSNPSSYFEFWLIGFFFFITICGAVFLVGAIIYLSYKLVKLWLKANWRWAKIIAESGDSKIKRLKEKQKIKKISKIEEMEKDREKHGVCVGDTAISKTNIGPFTKGEKYNVCLVYVDGDVKVNDSNGNKIDYYCNPSKYFKIIKNKLPEKPKLDKKYIEQ